MLHVVKIITAQKLIKIDNQITEGRNGNPGDFETWRATAEVVLRYAVGDKDQLVTDFRDIRFGPLRPRGRQATYSSKLNVTASFRGLPS